MAQATQKGIVNSAAYIVEDATLVGGRYKYVKWGSEDGKVVLAGANDTTIGTAMSFNDSVTATLATEGAADSVVTVALIGGAALLKISETVALGKKLTSTAAGLGEVVDAAGENISSIAMGAGVVNDIIPVINTIGDAHASDA